MNDDNFERGLQCLIDGDGHEAVECFTRIIAEQPRNAEAFRQRALAHLLQNDRPRAVADYEVAVRLKPKEIQYRVERAAELFKQRRFADAINDCEEGLAIDASRTELLILRGRCHAALGNSVAALKDFDAAGAIELKVQLLRELGSFEEISSPPPV